MSLPDPRIDSYINKSSPFAQPVLRHIRRHVHKACPEVEETLKWGFPHFDYKGVMISMAAFKGHCTLNFWKARLIPGIAPVSEEYSAMGQFGRITDITDLPDDEILIGYILEARWREYVNWINDVKTNSTRDNRLATTIEWLAEGKTQNWRYAKK